MKYLVFIYITLFAVISIGCVGVFDIYSPNQIHRTVSPHPNLLGTYLVTYRHHEMIEKYGSGLDIIRKKVRAEDSIEDKLSIWDRDFEMAVPKYLKAKNLIPNECKNGVRVTSSMPLELSETAVSSFVCK